MRQVKKGEGLYYHGLVEEKVERLQLSQARNRSRSHFIHMPSLL